MFLACPICETDMIEVWDIPKRPGALPPEFMPCLVVHCGCYLTDEQEDAVVAARNANAEADAGQYDPN